MEKKRRRSILIACLFGAIFVPLLVGGVLYYRYAKQPAFNVDGEKPVWLYVYPEASWEAVLDSIEERTDAPLLGDLKLQLKMRAKNSPTVGAYTIEPSMTVQALYNRLVYGMQSPIGISFRSARLPGQIYRRLSKQLLLDSLQVAEAMKDTVLLHSIGIRDTTLVYYLLPNTYSVYWDITPQALAEKLAGETAKFWTDERKAQAVALGLSPYEVINLAAIVQEESAKEDEYPMIAGLYLNRLKMGMRLQADPTVKFALQDFGLRRILHKHLRVDSPYNTYKYTGLPPGPIRIPTSAAIDGVLNATQHDYIYMCAKSDFSGYHAFASTYRQHLQNAQQYVQELNKRGIN